MHKPRKDTRAQGWPKREQPIMRPCVVATVLSDGRIELSQAGLSNVVVREDWAQVLPIVRDLYPTSQFRVRAE